MRSHRPLAVAAFLAVSSSAALVLGAPAPERQPPQIVDGTIDIQIASQTNAKGDNLDFSPEISFGYLGVSNADDLVTLQYTQDGKPLGKPVECRVSAAAADAGRPAQGTLGCKATPEQVRLPGPGVYGLDMTYHLGAESRDVAHWRPISFEVIDYADSAKSRSLRVNLDSRIVEGWVSFSPINEGHYCDPDHMAKLAFTFFTAPTKEENHPDATMRCKVGGKPIGDGWTSQPDQLFARNVTDAATGEFLGYARYQVRTSFLAIPDWANECVARGQLAPTDAFLVKHPGDWECTLSLDAHPARVFRFKVDARGTIDYHAEQRGPGALVAAGSSRFVDVEVVGSHDRDAAKRRIGAPSYFGRPWKSAPLASMHPEPPPPPPTKPFKAIDVDRRIHVTLKVTTPAIPAWMAQNEDEVTIEGGDELFLVVKEPSGEVAVHCFLGDRLILNVHGRSGKKVSGEMEALCRLPSSYTKPIGANRIIGPYEVRADQISGPIPVDPEALHGRSMFLLQVTNPKAAEDLTGP